MPHLPTAEEQWGHWAEQAIPQLDIDDLHRRVADLRRIREEQAAHQAREPQQGSAYWDMLNGIGYTWSGSTWLGPVSAFTYDPTQDDLPRPKQPRHRLFNRRLPL